MLVLAGIATGNKIGLAAVAATFIAFALLSSFVAPRRWPGFPGRQGLSVFIIASFVLFGAMLTAIAVLAVEKPEAKAAGAEEGVAAAGKTIDVRESEFKIALAPPKEAGQGKYTFVVHNVGKVGHDLVVEGPNVSGGKRTPTIAPGGEAKLTVSLRTGSYTLYCSVPGHRQAGMETKLAVG